MTAIEWTDQTWNPVTGCSKVSAGCDHCYAETLALGRLKGKEGYPGLPWLPENAAQNVVLRPSRLTQPKRWKTPCMVFVNSMSDLFHPNVPGDYIAQCFSVMADCPQHTFQILTKRPKRMASWAEKYQPDPLPNVWMGTSIENADWLHRADALRKVSAAVRFISAEPLLGPLMDRQSCSACFEWPRADCDECDGLRWWFGYAVARPDRHRLADRRRGVGQGASTDRRTLGPRSSRRLRAQRHGVLLQAVGRHPSEVRWPRARRPHLGRVPAGGDRMTLRGQNNLCGPQVCSRGLISPKWPRAAVAKKLCSGVTSHGKTRLSGRPRFVSEATHVSQPRVDGTGHMTQAASQSIEPQEGS